MRTPKVLAITKRTAELCGTQALLYSAGFQLVTATNLVAAQSLIRAMGVKGVIVCRGSWTEQERDQLVAGVSAASPQVKVLMRCPGCTGCDDHHTPGTLCDTLPISSLIASLTPEG